MASRGLLEPGDKVTVTVVRAWRVQPGEIYWGAEMSPGTPRKGYVMESEGIPIPEGAVPHFFLAQHVQLGSYTLPSDALVLVESP